MRVRIFFRYDDHDEDSEIDLFLGSEDEIRINGTQEEKLEWALNNLVVYRDLSDIIYLRISKGTVALLDIDGEEVWSKKMAKVNVFNLVNEEFFKKCILEFAREKGIHMVYYTNKRLKVDD
jgi:hypothetical protein